jgi:hypothetical protein
MEGLENLKTEFKGIEPDSSKQAIKKEVNKLIELIESNLRGFVPSSSFKNITKKVKNENKHSEAFMDYLQKIVKGNYTIIPISQKGSAVVDIGIRWNSIVIFTIEAKVLPMPEPKNKERDIHEYVYKSNTGQGAGIERFRKGEHGLDDIGEMIEENGMIAYIKDKDFDYWLEKVNQWIFDANWSESEQLKVKYSDQKDKYISTHPRINNPNSTVTLHHFWVKVNL